MISPKLTKRNSPRRPLGRSSVRWTIDRLLSHAPAPARVVDEPTFMMLLDLELERARRHGRVFSITYFDVGHDANHDAKLAGRAVAEIRSCDVATFVDDGLIVLWTESLPVEVRNAIERIVGAGDGSLTLVKSVSFPRDALTRTSLLSQAMSSLVEHSPPGIGTDVLAAIKPDNFDNPTI